MTKSKLIPYSECYLAHSLVLSSSFAEIHNHLMWANPDIRVESDFSSFKIPLTLLEREIFSIKHGNYRTEIGTSSLAFPLKKNSTREQQIANKIAEKLENNFESIQKQIELEYLTEINLFLRSNPTFEKIRKWEYDDREKWVFKSTLKREILAKAKKYKEFGAGNNSVHIYDSAVVIFICPLVFIGDVQIPIHIKIKNLLS